MELLNSFKPFMLYGTLNLSGFIIIIIIIISQLTLLNY